MKTKTKSQTKPKNPMVANLSAQDFDIVKKDLQFIRDGGEIIYVVDYADLQDFIYPVGIDAEGFTMDKLLAKRSHQIAMEHFCYKREEGHQFMIVKEYLHELWNLKNVIIDRLKKGIQIMDYVRSSNSKIGYMTKDVVEMIENEYSLIASIKIGILGNGFKSFDKLLAKSNIILEQNHAHGEIINEISEIRKNEEDIFTVYDDFDDRSKEPENRGATMRDAAAITFTRQLNEAATTNRVYCYLSSQKKSKDLFKKSPDLAQEVNYRTSTQLFLWVITKRPMNSKNKKLVYNEMIDDIESLKDSYHQKNGQKALRKKLKSQIESHIDDYENWGVFGKESAEEYESISKEFLKRKFGSNIESIVKLIRTYIKDNKNFSKLAVFKQESSLLLITTYDEIINLLTNGKKLYERGNDPIESKSQILPICFPTELRSRQFTNLFNDLAKVLLGDNTRWPKLKEEILGILEKGKVKSDPEPEFLLLCSILTLLLETDKESILDLVRENDRYIALQKRIDKESLKEKYKHRNDVFSLELDYVACWALRRARAYTNSLERARKNLNIKDPRFYHSQFLTAYCIWHEMRKTEGFNEYYHGENITIEQVIGYGEETYTLYQKTRHNYTQVQRCLEALENSLCYLYAFKVKEELKKETSEMDITIVEGDLAKAKEYLKKLKESLSKEKWEDYPEYSHTEALFNLSHARYFREIGNIGRSRFKYEKAIEDVEDATKSCSNNSRKRLLKRCKELKDQIKKELSSLN